MSDEDQRMATSIPTIDTVIGTDPKLRGGEPIIAGTATTVRAIAELWNMGMAPEEIPLHISHLTVQQVFAALHYYLGHRQEIDGFIAANRIPEEWAGKRFDPATRQVK
jgi:uncharacterized protein (DUF433 family)